jgi:hypothetical protein
MAPKLDYGGQLAAFLEHLTDGLGCRLVDAEHGANMGAELQRASANHANQAPAGKPEILSGPFASGARHRDGDTGSVHQDGDPQDMISA